MLYQDKYDGKEFKAKIHFIVAGLIEEITVIDMREIEPDDHFVDDLGMTSMDMVEFAVEAENRLLVRVANIDLSDIRTVRAVVEFITASAETDPEINAALHELLGDHDVRKSISSHH